MNLFEQENKRRTGFYFAGEFSKGRKAGCLFLPQSQKPFEVDAVEGTVTGKGISTITPGGRSHRAFFANEWFFVEGHKLGDLDKNKLLAEVINDTWKMWCKKHKRKYQPIMDLSKYPGDEKCN